MNPTLLIAVITNNDQKRISHVVPNVKELAALSNGSIKIFESQPNIEPVSIYNAIRRDIFLSILERQWRIYRHQATKSMIKEIMNIFKNIIKKYVLKNTVSYRRKISIEKIITNKHFEAWKTAVDNMSDLIVFEDDAIFNASSIPKILEIIKQTKIEALTPIYIDFAGGLPLDALKIDLLIKNKMIDKIEFFYPATNTCCCYYVDNKLAQELVRQINEKKLEKIFAIDWLLNKFFIANRSNSLSIHCWHIQPNVIQHGSFFANYNSWQS